MNFAAGATRRFTRRLTASKAAQIMRLAEGSKSQAIKQA